MSDRPVLWLPRKVSDATVARARRDYEVILNEDDTPGTADQIIVMSAGRVEQVGTPEEVYNLPATEFVANFLGASNILPARCTGKGDDGARLEVDLFGEVLLPADKAGTLNGADRAKLVLRAEKLLVMGDGATADGMVSAPATVETVDYQGQTVRYFVRVRDTQLQAINMIDGHPFAEGQQVRVAFRSRDCAALPEA